LNISVVIPAYNAANNIKAAIDSCLQQSHQPHEIIVVDDASTDNTVEIAQQYEKVKVISLPQNSGPSAARNKGWDIATGDIIAFLDSDDTWTIDKLATVGVLFKNHDNILYLGHAYSLNDTDVNNVQAGELSTLNYTGIILKNPFQPSCLVVRRSLKERFDESYRYCEDHELSIRIAHKHQCHWLDVPLTKLGRPQLSIGGASGNIWKMRKGELRLYSSIYRHNPVYVVFIPFLWFFSLGKMLYRLAFK